MSEKKDVWDRYHENMMREGQEAIENSRLARATQEFDELIKDMSQSKFQKGTKELGKTFKHMALASIKTNVLEKLFMLLEPFISLLNIFNPLFQTLSAIFNMALLPVIQTLTPVIADMSKWLFENKDAIIAVISALSPLILIFEAINGTGPGLSLIFDSINFQFKAMKTIFGDVDWIAQKIWSTFSNLQEKLSSLYYIVHNLVIKIFDFIRALENLSGYYEKPDPFSFFDRSGKSGLQMLDQMKQDEKQEQILITLKDISYFTKKTYYEGKS